MNQQLHLKPKVYLGSTQQLGLCGSVRLSEARRQILAVTDPVVQTPIMPGIVNGEAEGLQASSRGFAVLNAYCGVHPKGDNVRDLVGGVSRGEGDEGNPQQK